MIRLGICIATAAFALTAASPAAAQSLTPSDIGGVIARVVNEANARRTPATIAVVDRSGAVLAVYQMAGAPTAFPVINNPNGPTNAGLNGATLPATAEAISKAITAAYLSTTHGNAFTTRTASQIIQDHFNPGTQNAASGPLYGVQFSSLPCSDLVVRLSPTDPSTLTRGPHRAPLGLAGDPGGLPLYKNGELVGAVGVKAVGVYGLDLDIHVNDNNTDEILALAGTIGLDAPANLRADQITVGGLLLRYTDASPADLLATPATAPAYSSLPALLVDVPGYYDHTNGLIPGSAYATVPFGLVPDAFGLISTATPANLLVDGRDQLRFPPSPGAGRSALSTHETLTILRNAYAIALQARAQIRNSPGAHAAVTISIVDASGNVLGIASTPDAPMFGIDVSLQKARSAAFLSSPQANAALRGTAGVAAFATAANSDFRTTAFNGAHAWSARAIGTIARDTLPDGIDGTPNGPLNLPARLSNPFDDGLQLDLVTQNLTSPVTQDVCTALPPTPGNRSNAPPLANGLQVFPGGFPIYRNGILVGGIGVSGDGVDQDDLISFLGLYNAGQALRSGIGHAPAHMRAGTLTAHGVAPKYVNCPYAPFVNSASHNVCSGK
jgi:uncharacterized protein GlcG (DUF336 family)